MYVKRTLCREPPESVVQRLFKTQCSLCMRAYTTTYAMSVKASALMEWEYPAARGPNGCCIVNTMQRVSFRSTVPCSPSLRTVLYFSKRVTFAVLLR